MKMKMLRRVVPAVAVAALLVAGPVFAADEGVVARVNGTDITTNEVDLAMQIFAEQLQQVPEAARRSMVIDALVDIHVMADAARKEGLADSAKFKDRLAFLTAQALRNSYIEDKIQGGITEDELKARYEKDVKGYTPPEEVRARHILVKTKEEADQVIKDLAGGGDFAKIAAEKSQDPGSKDNGGDLGFFGKGQMVPEFETAAFGMQPGDVSKEPVQTQFGFHVLKVEEKRTQPVPTFEEVKPQVTEALQREKFQEVLTKLKSEAKVEMIEKPAEAPAAEPAPDAAPAAPAQ